MATLSSSPSSRLLQNFNELSPQELGFLDNHFRSREDLIFTAPHILSSLSQQCTELEEHILKLQNNLTKTTVSWIRRSFAAKSAIHKLNHKLEDLSLRTSSQYGIGSKKFKSVLGDAIPQLAKEMRRIEYMRCYIETTLQLEAMVGDLEDAALIVMARSNRMTFSMKHSNSPASIDALKRQAKLHLAIKTMNGIEELFLLVQKSHPPWHCLFRSVDNRVGKILATLRPQVFVDYRNLLVSLGWPPKLLTSNSGSGCMLGIPNPLIVMQGDKRKAFSDSFIALCALQHLQSQREKRKLNQKQNMQLWAIDELVSPIAARMEYHFSKWADQPEFMFALVYKVTNDFVEGIDLVLQPLIDETRLVNCSAKEAWVSAMVQTLSAFLAKRFFSLLAEKYKEKHMLQDVTSSWLHLIGLIVSFDRQMQSLVDLNTGLFLLESERYEGISRGISVLTIFCDRLEWLKIWAKIEFKNGWNKLKAELKEEKAWLIGNEDTTGYRLDLEPQQSLIFSVEDLKAPPIAKFAAKVLWEMIEHCHTMPSILSRIQFIRSSAGKLLWHFFKILILQCNATTLQPDSHEDSALINVCGLINAARHIEHKLQEWSDCVEFLEMKIAENDLKSPKKDYTIDNGCFFGEEISSLSELETNWLMEIIVVLLRKFEMLTREYVQTKDNFELEDPSLRVSEAMDLTVSLDLLEALDTLRIQMHLIRINLNTKDFFDLWRSVAEGLDHYISFSMLKNAVQFSEKGIAQFKTDMKALFTIFQPFCVRPQAFFPRVQESTKLLQMNK